MHEQAEQQINVSLFLPLPLPPPLPPLFLWNHSTNKKKIILKKEARPWKVTGTRFLFNII